MDRISKRYASVDMNGKAKKLDMALGAHITKTKWPFGCNLMGLPERYFLLNLPTPPPPPPSFFSNVQATGHCREDGGDEDGYSSIEAAFFNSSSRQPTQKNFAGLAPSIHNNNTSTIPVRNLNTTPISTTKNRKRARAEGLS